MNNDVTRRHGNPSVAPRLLPCLPFNTNRRTNGEIRWEISSATSLKKHALRRRVWVGWLTATEQKKVVQKAESFWWESETRKKFEF